MLGKRNPIMNKFISLLIIALSISLDCDKSTSEPNTENLFVKTDKTSYSQNELVTFTIQNESESNAFFIYCGPYLILEINKKNEDVWMNYSATVCPAIYRIENKELEAGSSYSDSTVVTDIGTYRFVVPFGWENKVEFVDSLISNEFIVH